jgi:hypothetical protein
LSNLNNSEIAVNEGKVSFFHGTDYSSAQNIVSNGVSAEVGRNFGGAGSFWAIIALPGRESDAVSMAKFFAQANPAENPKWTIITFEVISEVLIELKSKGLLEIREGFVRFFPNALPRLNEVTSFSICESEASG